MEAPGEFGGLIHIIPLYQPDGRQLRRSDMPTLHLGGGFNVTGVATARREPTGIIGARSSIS